MTELLARKRTRRRQDNALAESFLGTLETELLDRRTYIDLYNARPPASTLGYRSPDRCDEEKIRPDLRQPSLPQHGARCFVSVGKRLFCSQGLRAVCVGPAGS